MDPIIEPFLTSEDMKGLKKVKSTKTFLGYEFSCFECDWFGYLKNKHQLLCPKCGSPFYFENGDEPELIYEITKPSDFTKLKDIIKPDDNDYMGEEVIVEEEDDDEPIIEDIIIDDIITDNSKKDNNSKLEAVRKIFDNCIKNKTPIPLKPEWEDPDYYEDEEWEDMITDYD